MEASLGPMLNSKQVFLSSPDAVKLRITEDTSLTTPIAADTPELSVPDPAVAQTWYAKWFGAKLARHKGELVGEIPGSNLLFAKAAGEVAPTKGRAFDRVGLEARNIGRSARV